jgi:hypothetical protein
MLLRLAWNSWIQAILPAALASRVAEATGVYHHSQLYLNYLSIYLSIYLFLCAGDGIQALRHARQVFYCTSSLSGVF